MKSLTNIKLVGRKCQGVEDEQEKVLPQKIQQNLEKVYQIGEVGGTKK